MEKFSLRNPTFLEKVNAATKYPSIPTYHKLGDKGRLTEEHNIEFVGEVVGTEKVDGCNTRIIIPPMSWDGAEYLVGSREELLYADGDLIINPASQIVETVKPWLDLKTTMPRMADLEDELIGTCADICHPGSGCCGGRLLRNPEKFMVLYLESYGGKAHTASWKQYTTSGTPSFRLFDIALIPTNIMSRSSAWIAQWRDNHLQEWLDEDTLAKAAYDLGLALTPRLFRIPAEHWPTSIQDVYGLLVATFPNERTHLPIELGAQGRAEGLVIRTPSSNKIAKVRFTDYKRTLGMGTFSVAMVK